MKLLFFDLETTGVKYWRNGIHQISGEIVIDGETKEFFNFNVRPNPQCDIEEEALRVCNVSREQIMAYPPMHEVYTQFVEMLSRYVDKYKKEDKFFLVGYNNASFDNNFLKAFFVQNKDNYFYSWFWVNSIDVMVLASLHLAEKRHTMPDFKLETVARHLGIALDASKLHDAAYDIQLTKEVYQKMGKM
ncbi:3'-5' exonuclease [Parabacteroides sp. 52]|uniref:3'-5' exonuclease n=1 Tax=unclassified Parabacteroides TaxID=2649774 RepID=UPI0013D3237F|nr:MULTISPECIES: 3'-5' exonuclease [unclassified Parabacteroides]MDH6534460.1 DNA polymerase-3 subunit epsilon [Parabacteroides sp. PM5-20]NDV55091.1 3'-5' exonuclease [Parabacteroides sp. 52]